MGTSEGASAPPGSSAPCSDAAAQIFVLNSQPEPSSAVPLPLCLRPCGCCSGCLPQTAELWPGSLRATTAPAGSSSAPCPEAHSCSSARGRTARCWCDRVRRSVCPHRAAAESSPHPHPRSPMSYSAPWRTTGHPAARLSMRRRVWTGPCTVCGGVWHSVWPWR